MIKVEEQRTLRKLERILKGYDHLAEAAVPELAFKPHVMANIESTLTFLAIASIGSREESDWKTLRLIESLFEVKLFFGNKSIFNIILHNKPIWKPYCLELLENFFDKITTEAQVTKVSDIFAEPKESNFRLWDLEREYESNRSYSTSDEILRPYDFRDSEKEQLVAKTYEKLQRISRYVDLRYPVDNLKNYYVSEQLNLRFYFDFKCNNHLIDIVSFKRLSETQLLNLLIKSRLIRYQKINNQIEMRHLNFSKLILLVNGNITGPSYDKLRFLRMLNHAGWDVHPLNISIRKLRSVLR